MQEEQELLRYWKPRIYKTEPVRTGKGDMATLKAERFARWQSEMLPNEKDEIDNAHNLCIFLLREYINQLK